MVVKVIMPRNNTDEDGQLIPRERIRSFGSADIETCNKLFTLSCLTIQLPGSVPFSYCKFMYLSFNFSFRDKIGTKVWNREFPPSFG